MALPLMPKATAVWLVEHTSLSFEQIAAFCGLHPLEVQAIADDEVAIGMVGLDPVANGQLSQEEIVRCEADPLQRLRMSVQDLPPPMARSKGPRYTPVTKRGDKPDAVVYLLKNYPELSDAQICRLIGTTKPTIASVRDKSHWNAANIKPSNPVLLGLCTQRELDEALAQVRRRTRTSTTDAQFASPEIGIVSREELERAQHDAEEAAEAGHDEDAVAGDADEDHEPEDDDRGPLKQQATF
ncbi:MAG: DUF1013 domain-containing protein [Azospirillaceae bacterium]|nr:DUF1013 domain-containing protein [Azospirillaceae bacterium]